MQRESRAWVTAVERFAEVDGKLADETLAATIHYDRVRLHVERKRQGLQLAFIYRRYTGIDQRLVHVGELRADGFGQMQRIALVTAWAAKETDRARKVPGEKLCVPFKPAGC